MARASEAKPHKEHEPYQELRLRSERLGKAALKLEKELDLWGDNLRKYVSETAPLKGTAIGTRVSRNNKWVDQPISKSVSTDLEFELPPAEYEVCAVEEDKAILAFVGSRENMRFVVPLERLSFATPEEIAEAKHVE